MKQSITAVLVFTIALAMSAGMAIGQKSQDRGAWMSTDCDRGIDQPEKCIEGLLAQYPGDGSTWLELGPQICKSVVAHTKVFLLVASQHPAAFDAWLRDLPENTFAILEPEDSVETELQAAYLHKLRDLMLAATAAVPRNDPQYRLVTRLRDVVNAVKIEGLAREK
jgi:hypothetical protein